MSLLNYYGWNKFSIIYEEAWEKVAESLILQAKDSNKTINQKLSVTDRHKCCGDNLDCCRPGYWYQVSLHLVPNVCTSFQVNLHIFCPQTRSFKAQWIKQEFTFSWEARMRYLIWWTKCIPINCSTKANTWWYSSIWWVIQSSKRILIFLHASLGGSFVDTSQKFQSSKIEQKQIFLLDVTLNRTPSLIVFDLTSIKIWNNSREAKKYLYRVEQFSKYKSCHEIEGLTKRARSLLVVVSTPPTTKYEEFTDKVREYNTKVKKPSKNTNLALVNTKFLFHSSSHRLSST